MTPKYKKHHCVKHETLCWCCEWAAGKDGKCPWANNFEPVPGWKAKPTKLLIYGTYNEDGTTNRKYIDSFDVYECPLFETMTEIKMQQAEHARKREQRKIIIKNIDNDLELVERLWLEEHLELSEIAAETGLSHWKIHNLKKKIKESWKK